MSNIWFMLLKNKFDIKMNGFQDPKSFFIVLFFLKQLEKMKTEQ